MSRDTLPLITRGEQRAIERLFASSFNLLDCLRAFVRNRAVIHADEPFVDPLHQLFNQAEDALEQAGFWPEDYNAAEAVSGHFRKQPVDITLAHLVIIESPYAGQVTANVAYARQCMRDSLLRGEHPIASHLLYTQPGILDDDKPDERKRGIEAGLAWRKAAQKAVFYTGMGWSRGMREAKAVYEAEGFPFEERDMPALPLHSPYPSNMPFPADPFGKADRHEPCVDGNEGLFDGERIVPASELEVGDSVLVVDAHA